MVAELCSQCWKNIRELIFFPSGSLHMLLSPKTEVSFIEDTKDSDWLSTENREGGAKGRFRLTVPDFEVLTLETPSFAVTIETLTIETNLSFIPKRKKNLYQQVCCIDGTGAESPHLKLFSFAAWCTDPSHRWCMIDVIPKPLSVNNSLLSLLAEK